VFLPARAVIELVAEIARVLRLEVGEFLAGEMHGGLREVLQAAGVVHIQVSDDDVPHLRRVEAEALELRDRRQRLVDREAPDFHELRAEALQRPLHFGEAETGVDEGETGSVLQQQAMAGGEGVRIDGDGAHGAEI
jgi:hypothetical protein